MSISRLSQTTVTRRILFHFTVLARFLTSQRQIEAGELLSRAFCPLVRPVPALVVLIETEQAPDFVGNLSQTTVGQGATH